MGRYGFVNKPTMFIIMSEYKALLFSFNYAKENNNDDNSNNDTRIVLSVCIIMEARIK